MAPHRSSSSSKKRSSATAVTVVAAAAVIATLPGGARAGGIVRGLDLCTSYSRVCSDATSQVDCQSHFDGQTAKPMLTVQSCAHNSYDTFVGHCKCAALDLGNVVLQELVDYSVTTAMPLLQQPHKTVANATDYGATYVKACTTFLGGSKCPDSLKFIAGYGAKGGFADFKGDCRCGTVDASAAVKESLNAYLLAQKLNTTGAALPPAAAPDNTNTTAPATGVDVCTTFDAACATFLEDIACPATLRANRGCTTPNAADTLAGTCRCGAMDASESVKTAILGLALPGAALEAAKVYTKESQAAAAAAAGNKPSGAPEGAAVVEPTVEFCGTYARTCAAFLTAAGVAPELHEAEPNCIGGEGTNLATFRGRCAAGSLDVSSAVTAFLVGKSVEQDVDDLVCLGLECGSYKLNAGVMAIVVISGVLAGVFLLLFAYQRGDAWARACMANSLVSRLLYPCACLFRRPRGDKTSPQVTDHQVHLKGMMA